MLKLFVKDSCPCPIIKSLWIIPYYPVLYYRSKKDNFQHAFTSFLAFLHEQEQRIEKICPKTQRSGIPPGINRLVSHFFYDGQLGLSAVHGQGRIAFFSIVPHLIINFHRAVIQHKIMRTQFLLNCSQRPDPQILDLEQGGRRQ